MTPVVDHDLINLASNYEFLNFIGCSLKLII